MKRSNKAMLAAGMLAGVCMLTGCASGGSAQPTPSPDVAQQQSAEPSPEASEEPAEEAPLSLTVDGKAVEPAAMEENGRLTTTGAKRTGCMFCMFGVHLEKEPNRFQRMALTHPKQYDFCIHKLGCGKVLDFLGVPYAPNGGETP